MTVIALLAAVLALLPLALAARNLALFKAPRVPAPPDTRVSILIPARNEASTIGAAIDAALASTGCEVEVVVLDDQSTDGTATVVQEFMQRDARVRLEHAPPLPSGWAGKQRACWLLAKHARFGVLMFIDADVRLTPEAAALGAGFLLRDGFGAPAHLGGARLGLVSGFPLEETRSIGEHLVIPWIHVLLLGYLPIGRMRRSSSSAYGAGCGQLMIARRGAYFATGGHEATPASLHDGTSLPRTFRNNRWTTDIFDATQIARCHMYNNVDQVWAGFAKSAGEGIATPIGLPIWTLLIFGGHVLPWVLLVVGVSTQDTAVIAASAAGVAANLTLRLLLRARFKQSLIGAVLHPIGALIVLAINWVGLGRHLAGRPNIWRGRSYLRSSH
ncbi:MAG: glycosyltransferase [Burkholderiaceae bacterium]|nr:glycosyltransferase [Burkholderiaceae bacterium]